MVDVCIDLTNCDDLVDADLIIRFTKYLTDSKYTAKPLSITSYNNFHIGDRISVSYDKVSEYTILGFAQYGDMDYVTVFYEGGGHDNVNVMRPLGKGTDRLYEDYGKDYDWSTHN